MRRVCCGSPRTATDDQSCAPHRNSARKRWKEFVNQHDGLKWHARFAAAHDKPMTFPEWGLVHRRDGIGGGDNSYFIAQMRRWIKRHKVAYQIYFNGRDPNAEYAISSGRFPKAEKRFLELFGAKAHRGRSRPDTAR